MHTDKNEFFREATMRLCGNLDIKQAMRDCCDFISKFVPLNRMYLQLFDPDLNVLRIVSSVVREGEEGSRVLHIPQEYKDKWIHDWDGYAIINDPIKEPWFWRDLITTRRSTDISLFLLRLKIEDKWFCWLALVKDGQGAYTEEHAQLMLLLKKPITIAVANALRHEEVLRLKELLADEHRRLYQKLRELSTDVIGKQRGLKEVMAMCHQIAPLDSPVLLLGETGVGKDLLAHAIHTHSPRKQNPFVSVNCGAVAETLIDSELFGHEKGAFTGAISQKIGRFERADKGTIFLDEIGDLSPQGQVRLLHVLQYKEIERVGGTRPIPVDTRIIAATNKNLEEMVKLGQFRKDLWFRLSVFPITIPPLRERKEDIPELLYYFIEQKRKTLKLDISPRLAPGAIEKLMAYDWPGNVRELINVVERALIRNRDGLLGLEELVMIPPQIEQGSAGEIVDQTETVHNLAEINARHIRQILNRTKGKINGPRGAAELLGIHPNTLRKRMDKLGISYKRIT